MVKELEEQCLWAIQWLGPRLNINFTIGNEWAWWALHEAIMNAGSVGFEYRHFKTVGEYEHYRLWETKVEMYVAIKQIKRDYMKGVVTYNKVAAIERYYNDQVMRLEHNLKS